MNFLRSNNAYSYFHIINFGDIYGYGRNAFDNRCMDFVDFFNATWLTFAPRAGKFATVDVKVDK